VKRGTTKKKEQKEIKDEWKVMVLDLYKLFFFHPSSFLLMAYDCRVLTEKSMKL